MGRFYQSGPSRFLSDFIYEPDQNLQLSLAQQEATTDAAKGQLDQIGFDTKQTFGAWQAESDAEVQALNEQADAIVDKLKTDPLAQDTRKMYSELLNQAKTTYSSGKVGAMHKQFKDYSKKVQDYTNLIEKEKNNQTKANMKKRLNEWTQYVTGRQVPQGFEGFQYNELQDYTNKQGLLEKNVPVENMKELIKGYESNALFAVTDKGSIPIRSSTQVKTVQGPDGKPQKIAIIDGKEYPVQTAQHLVTKQIPGLKHQYYSNKFERERFQQEAIRQVSLQELASDPSVNAEIQQDFFDFNLADDAVLKQYQDQYIRMNQGRPDFDPTSITPVEEMTTEEKYNFYRRTRLENEANIFAAKHSGIKDINEMQQYKDDYTIKSSIQGQKDKAAMDRLKVGEAGKDRRLNIKEAGKDRRVNLKIGAQKALLDAKLAAAGGGAKEKEKYRETNRKASVIQYQNRQIRSHKDDQQKIQTTYKLPSGIKLESNNIDWRSIKYQDIGGGEYVAASGKTKDGKPLSEEDLKSIMNQSSQPYLVTAQKGTLEYDAQMRVKNSDDYAREQLKNKTIDIGRDANDELVKVPANEYLDFLGGREHTTDTYTQFMEYWGAKNRPALLTLGANDDSFLNNYLLGKKGINPEFASETGEGNWIHSNATTVGDMINGARDKYYDDVYKQTKSEVPVGNIINKANYNAIMDNIHQNPQSFDLVDPKTGENVFPPGGSEQQLLLQKYKGDIKYTSGMEYGTMNLVIEDENGQELLLVTNPNNDLLNADLQHHIMEGGNATDPAYKDLKNTAGTRIETAFDKAGVVDLNNPVYQQPGFENVEKIYNTKDTFISGKPIQKRQLKNGSIEYYVTDGMGNVLNPDDPAENMEQLTTALINYKKIKK